MKNLKKIAKLLDCEWVLCKSGNIVGLGTLNKNVGQSGTEEIEICLSSTIDKWLEKEEDEQLPDSGGQIVVDCCSRAPVKAEERAELKITVKVFVNSASNASVREAVQMTLEEMGVSSVETVILSVTPSALEGVSHLDAIKPFWRQLEQFVAEGVVYSLGISDLKLEQLTALYEWAQVKPLTHQVNLASCCTIPPEMAAYAKQHDIQLFTHSDPTEILPSSSIDKIIQSKLLPDHSPLSTLPPNPPSHPSDHSATTPPSHKHLHLAWLSRYLVLITCRGIIKSKGYLAKLHNKI